MVSSIMPTDMANMASFASKLSDSLRAVAVTIIPSKPYCRKWTFSSGIDKLYEIVPMMATGMQAMKQ